MPPIKINPPKMIDFSQVGKLDNVNLGNQYGVGSWSYTGQNSNGQGSTQQTSNTPVDLNNDNVRGNLATYAKTQHPNWSDSRIWHGVENMWTGQNMYGQQFNAQGQTIGVNPPNQQTNNMGYNQGSGQLGSYRNQVGNGQTYSWDSNNNAFYTQGNNVGVGTTGLAHSGANVQLDPNTRYNFGNNRIGRKLGAAYDATTGTINTANLGRRSMRRLRNVLNQQQAAGAPQIGQQQQQGVQWGNVNLSQQFPNLFPPGFSFNNQFGLTPNFNTQSTLSVQETQPTQETQTVAGNQAAAGTQAVTPAARSERFNTNQQFGKVFTNYDKYGNGESWNNYLKRVQNALIEAGYDVGSTGADGMWGNNTSTAWGNFIRDHNAIDGENTITNLLSGKYKAKTTSDYDNYLNQMNANVGKPEEEQHLNDYVNNMNNNVGNQEAQQQNAKREVYTSTSETRDGKTVYVDSKGNKYVSKGPFGGYTRISRNGGILSYAYGSQIKAKTSQTPALDAIMNNPQLAEQFLAALSQQMGKEITIDQLSAAAADPEMGQELEMIAQQMMKRAARHGAKLEYVSILRGKCPSGQELVYFAKGGRICSACMGKKLENGGEPGYMKSFRDRQKKKQMEKCGGKMKKGK